MTTSRARGRARLGGIAVALLALLHQDLWLADDPRLVFGLPASLLYHLGYCFAAAGVMAWLWRRFGPSGASSGATSSGQGEA